MEFPKKEIFALLNDSTCAEIFKDRVVQFFVNIAKQQKVSRVYLNAQTNAVGFYEKLGFHRTGNEFMDAGIEHVRMERAIE